MAYTSKELTVVRDLAKRYMEIALSDKHVRMRQRFLDTNDLKLVRPPVLMDEIPWHEMNGNGELDCKCEDERLRGVEYSLRAALFREKYFKCDNLIEPCWPVGKSYTSSGNGFRIQEQRLAVDGKNHIVSHHYEDILENESALALYHDPVITPHPEKDAANVAELEEIFGGAMPVRLRGANVIYYAPWDDLAMYRGVEPILIDMYERPEYLHELMRLMTRSLEVTMDQMERYGLYDCRGMSLHCTPAAVTLPDKADPEHSTCRNVWFRTMAQMFNMVSPAQHDEFDIQYSIPLAARCAYTYYGCCEPLHDRIDKLEQYPNLRKVGVSPWADIEKSAEMIGGKYVYSRKPNPAYVAIKVDADLIRREITDTVKVCQKYGCPLDITLKDISTVSYKPENLIIWAQTVSDVLDEYYGEA